MAGRREKEVDGTVSKVWSERESKREQDSEIERGEEEEERIKFSEGKGGRK